MVGAEAEFIFSDEWKPLIKTAVFIAGSEKRVVLEAAWRDNICTIPHECLAAPGVHLSVGVYGTDASGSLVIPTFYADLGMIWPGTEPDGETGAQASPELWAQLQAQLDLKESAGNKVTSLSEESTDSQYPSAKAVREYVGSYAAKKAAAVSLTIAASDWTDGASVTKQVDGVDQNSIVICDCSDASVECSAQGDGTLTFTSGSVPTADVTVKAVIL